MCLHAALLAPPWGHSCGLWQEQTPVRLPGLVPTCLLSYGQQHIMTSGEAFRKIQLKAEEPHGPCREAAHLCLFGQAFVCETEASVAAQMKDMTHMAQPSRPPSAAAGLTALQDPKGQKGSSQGKTQRERRMAGAHILNSKDGR